MVAVQVLSLQKAVANPNIARALIAVPVFLVLWQFAALSGELTGFAVPWVGVLPAPSSVLVVWWSLLGDPGYWQSWYVSTLRILAGFTVAMLIGIPLGLLMAVSKTLYATVFPPFEVLRPIPPLAWIPASIIFWPTSELSIGFIIFLGAFFTVVINVLGGARSIDARYIEAARSMGSSRRDIFRRIILPGTIPSIVVGATVAMGVTWEVLVAAEMIAGGSSSMSGGSGDLGATAGGLGYFLWNSYIGGAYAQIIVGMFSIGIAGYLCSSAIRTVGDWLTPWLRMR